jgi:hypothetical protein
LLAFFLSSCVLVIVQHDGGIEGSTITGFWWGLVHSFNWNRLGFSFWKRGSMELVLLALIRIFHLAHTGIEELFLIMFSRILWWPNGYAYLFMLNHFGFHFLIIHYLIPIFRPLYVVCRLCVDILPMFHLGFWFWNLIHSSS